MNPSTSDLTALLAAAQPALIIAFGALALALLARSLKPTRASLLAWLGAALIACIGYLETVRPLRQPVAGPLLLRDMFSDFFIFLLLTAGGLALFTAVREAETPRPPSSQRPALILFALFGPLLMVITAHLPLVLVAAVLLWLAAWWLLRVQSPPAARLYLMRVAFPACALLLGLLLLRGSVPSLDLAAIGRALNAPANSLSLTLGYALLLAGLLAQIAVVPFHVWTSDIWGTTPASCRIILTAGSLAAVAPVARLVIHAPGADALLWFLGSLTVLVGALLALNETSPHRTVARIATANSGYLLLGLLGGAPDTAGPSAFYALTYLLVLSGCAAALASSHNSGAGGVANWSGLARLRPRTAALFSFLLLAAAGVPLTGGFVATANVYLACVGAGYLGASVAAGVGSLLLLLCVAGAIGRIYGGQPPAPDAERPPGDEPPLTLVLCVMGILVLGLWPQSVLLLAEAAGQVLR